MVVEISPEELARKLDDDAPQLIDIRPPGAFAQEHVPGALNVPMTELTSRVDDIEFGDEVVVACQIGQSSKQAVKLLSSFEGTGDTDLQSLSGGLDAWDGPVETGPAEN
ncbi:rhodanese-like domain-containing protein [Halolamina salifodinae]|uniref:Rhodanese-related sulfurtransferase n=1 Tax=Halolamina salifodinae TaxID=1202767 RepID=A0A8T4GWQ9_9EURY|nr:rhodanese-like domain-containing protein [Halolamina salifodinae]MBP1987339.1 rhodanese-related sulfurtransferase [Halolamina salifodinae]